MEGQTLEEVKKVKIKNTQGETGRRALVSELVKKLDAFFKP